MSPTPTHQQLKRQIEELKTSADRSQRTFDAIASSVCILDPDWVIVQANTATADIFQTPPDKIIGRKCFELLHGTSTPISNCPVLRTKKSHKRETEAIQMGNRWFEITADPIYDDDENLKWIVHIVRDITEQKELLPFW